MFDFCAACCVGKSHRLPSSLSQTLYFAPLELIYCDLWGPSHISSSNGFSYYIGFVDVYLNFTWIYFLKNKLEKFYVFCNLKPWLNSNLIPKLRVFK